MTCCILETFANKVIFDKKLWIACNYEVQRYVPLEKKIFKIIPNIKHKPDYFKKNNFSKTYEKINKIRNDIVHQKSSTEESNETIELINKILEADWNKIIEEIKKVIDDLNTGP